MRMSWWWRSKNSQDQEQADRDAFVHRLADVNAFSLENVYRQQLEVAAECRRELKQSPSNLNRCLQRVV